MAQELIPTGLADWVLSAAESAGLVLPSPMVMLPLPGDAGFRRYFRVEGSRPAVMAVYSPPATENTDVYLRTSRWLEGAGARVPRVLAVDLPRGFLIVEDLGNILLWQQLNDQTVDNYYHQAMSLLGVIQSRPVAVEDGMPPYDARRLRDEMALFPEWFVERLLGVTLSASARLCLEAVFARLVDSALEQPVGFVHRDYHSRNLMCPSTGPLATIDFQDAVLGPVTYDLVSLLRDCYIAWPDRRVQQWALDFRHMRQQAGLPAGRDAVEFLRWFDWMGLQRHIKVLGIFARLYLRDGKPRYLEDLPLVIAYTLGVARRYPEFADFVGWFEAALMDLIKQQPWYRTVNIEGLP